MPAYQLNKFAVTHTCLLILLPTIVYSTRLTTEYVQGIVGKHAAAEILHYAFTHPISATMLVKSKLFNCNNEL